MKKRNQFFRSGLMLLGFASATLLLTLSMQSCNTRSDKQDNSKELAEERNDAKFDNERESDAEFLVDAAEINLEEIELGLLAQNRGTSAQVREMGKMMETEHSKALSDLKTLAQNKNISIPTTVTEDALEAKNNLAEKDSNDFDKEYVDKMVSAHKDAIDKFEKASTDAHDADIRNWAASMVPVLRQHVDKFVGMQETYEKR